MMNTVILVTLAVTVVTLAVMVIALGMRRRRARDSRDQYLSPAGLRLLRAHTGDVVSPAAGCRPVVM